MEANYLNEQRINAASRKGRRDGEAAFGGFEQRTACADRPAIRDWLPVVNWYKNQERREAVHLVDARCLPDLQARWRDSLLYKMGCTRQLQACPCVGRFQDKVAGGLGQISSTCIRRYQSTVCFQARTDLVGGERPLCVPGAPPSECDECPQAHGQEPNASNREAGRADAATHRSHNVIGRFSCRPIQRHRRNRSGVRIVRTTVLRSGAKWSLCEESSRTNRIGEREKS